MELQHIGLFGGTFNPVHSGHLRIAGEIKEHFSLDLVIFIPAGVPPHKIKSEVISSEHRLRMVELAVASYKYFSVSPIEAERKDFSYSIDTVTALKKDMGDSAEFYFIIGIDAFMEINTWKNANELMTLCNFVVIPRPGHRFTDLKDIVLPHPPIPPLSKGGDGGVSSDDLERLDRGEITRLSFPLSGGYYLFLEKIPLCDISSTELRRLIREGKEVRNLLPESVMSYIIQKGLYQC